MGTISTDVIAKAIAYSQENDFKSCKELLDTLDFDSLPEDIKFLLIGCDLDFELYEEASKLLSKVKPSLKRRSLYFQDLGHIYYHLNDEKEGKHCFKKGISIFNGEGYFAYAECLEGVGKIDDAIKYYYKAINHGYKTFQVYCRLSSILENINKDKESIKLLVKAKRLYPNEPFISYNMGVCFNKLGDIKNASLCYATEIMLEDRKEPMAFFNQALLLKHNNELDKAIECNFAGLGYWTRIKDNTRNKNLDFLTYAFLYNIICCYVLKEDFENAFDTMKNAYYENKGFFDEFEQDKEMSEFIKTDNYANYKKVILNEENQ